MLTFSPSLFWFSAKFSYYIIINKNLSFLMSEIDHFREIFKSFKRKKPPHPCFKEAIDFDSRSSKYIISKKIETSNSSTSEDHCYLCKNLGLIDHNSWEVSSISGFNGFLHLRNPFYASGQRKWIQKCLETYPQKPSVTNLDKHFPNVDNIWSLRNSDNPVERNYILKLYWATLGYNYDWDAKVYNPNRKSIFYECLKQLSKHIADCLGFKNFVPEAAIVNYYNMKSNLGIHNDHSEEYLNAPIISFSFGQTGIFLIGTEKRTDKPAAVFLRSGDIIVMYGPSRLAYHAVPCIISEDVKLRYSESEDNNWFSFEEYINRSRINVNVRQVYSNKGS